MNYIIKHLYEVDGGFGDAIPQEKVVGIVNCTEDEMKAFLEEYDKPFVYDEPYSPLTCYTLIAEEIKIVSLDEIEKDPYGDNGSYKRYIESFKKRDPNRFEKAQKEFKEWLEEEIEDGSEDS